MAEITSAGDSVCDIERSPVLIGSKMADGFSKKIPYYSFYFARCLLLPSISEMNHTSVCTWL
jgi:hypothetical protein